MTREELKAHCEKQMEMCEMWAISKGEKPSGKIYEEHKLILELLEQEPTTKNNLGVDCISRTQAQTEIEMNASRYTIAKERGGMGQVEWSDQLIKVSDAVDIIRQMPSATPQEPTEKCTWIKYDYRTVCPKEHDIDNPYWRIPENRMEVLKYCPYCGKEIEVEE